MLRHAIIAGLLTASAACADPDILHRIRRLTERIDRSPDEVSLLVARARLYHSDDNWPHALADLERALAAEPGYGPATLLKAETLLRAGRPGEAQAVIEPLVGATPVDAHALVVHARVLAARGFDAEAAAQLGAAIGLLDRPALELYVERARWLARSDDIERALGVLDRAAAARGGLVSLSVEAVRLARAAGAHDEALRRLDALIERSPRPERMLVTKGEVLVEAGRDAEARVVFEALVRSIDSMPDRVRGRSSFQELRGRATRALQGPPASTPQNGTLDR